MFVFQICPWLPLERSNEPFGSYQGFPKQPILQLTPLTIECRITPAAPDKL